MDSGRTRNLVMRKLRMCLMAVAANFPLLIQVDDERLQYNKFHCVNLGNNFQSMVVFISNARIPFKTEQFVCICISTFQTKLRKYIFASIFFFTFADDICLVHIYCLIPREFLSLVV